MRELRKVKSARSGDVGPPYESCWPLYKLLGFLESVVIIIIIIIIALQYTKTKGK